MEKLKIGISSCLLGEKVRYDGGHKWDRYITETLGQYFEWFSVCPEVEYGLPIPRETMHLVGDPESPRLVTVRTGIDHTKGMLSYTEKKLKELEEDDLCGFIFKSRSPSSGIGGVKIYTSTGMPSRTGSGIFGGNFVRHFPFIPVIDDGKLHDTRLRENFIERVFVYKRWQEFRMKGGLIRDLITFHTEHKLLILSHSPKHLGILGHMIGSIRQYIAKSILPEYVKILTEGLSLLATVKKHTNVLLHIAGYFKKRLSADDRKELLEVIEYYHKGYVPLIVPIVLIKHFLRKFDDPYLARQYYLNPHPFELMLRNHV